MWSAASVGVGEGLEPHAERARIHDKDRVPRRHAATTFAAFRRAEA
jgi:hypothetical protein